MAENVQVMCIRKRGGHHNPHERIEGLGGVHGGNRWYMLEMTSSPNSKNQIHHDDGISTPTSAAEVSED